MTEQELIEKLAEQEHVGWARWMAYFLSKCPNATPGGDGSLVIPGGYVRALKRQIATPYADLSEETKQLDRDEVAHILPIIRQFAQAEVREVEATGAGGVIPANTMALVGEGHHDEVVTLSACKECGCAIGHNDGCPTVPPGLKARTLDTLVLADALRDHGETPAETGERYEQDIERLGGSDPDFTGGLSSEEYVRQMREGEPDGTDPHDIWQDVYSGVEVGHGETPLEGYEGSLRKQRESH